MWNCSAPSSLLLPFSDDYVKCESTNSASGSAGFDGILAADYGHLCHQVSSLQGLPAPALFVSRSSESYFGMGDGSAYGGDGSPAFMHFGYTQTQPPTAATHPVRWTAAGGETMVCDGSSFSGSKRRKTTSAATTPQGPHSRLQGSSANPRNHAAKAPCKRSQKLGDKITALQQLVSPYGKTDTASVLHEAAACIRGLHQQIQILAAPYPGESSSPSSSQDAGEEPATGLRRRGLCVAPLSPAVVSLVSGAARDHGRAHADMGGAWFAAL